MTRPVQVPGSNSEARKRAGVLAGEVLDAEVVDRARGDRLAAQRAEIAALTAERDALRALLTPALEAVVGERRRQDAKWGEQNHPYGTGPDDWAFHRDLAQEQCRARFRDGDGTWLDVLLEEVYEAAAEDDPAQLRAELLQVGAVAVAWVEAIDRRGAGGAS